MLFDYSREPHSDIAFVDMKSFYASCECVRLGLNPLTTSLCVMSRSDNSAGLILASSPVFKQVFGKKNVSRSYDLPFDLKTRKFNSYAAKKQGLPTDPAFIASIESWAKRTLIVPPRMNAYIQVNMEIQKVFQEFAAPDDIFPYSIDEGFIDLTSSLNYFRSLPLSKGKTGSPFCQDPKKDLAGNWHLLYHRPQQCQSPSCQASLGQ